MYIKYWHDDYIMSTKKFMLYNTKIWKRINILLL